MSYLERSREIVDSYMPKVNGKPFSDALIRTSAALMIIGAGNLLRPSEVSAETKWIPNPESGVPAVDANTLVDYNIQAPKGVNTVVIAGPLEVGPVKFRGTADKEDNATVAIIVGANGPTNANVKVWPRGNWVGRTYANGDAEETKQLLLDRNAALRNPALKNGKDGNGVQGKVEWVVIDGVTGQPTDWGSVDAQGNIQVANKDAAPVVATTSTAATTVISGLPNCEDQRSYKPAEECLALPGTVITGDVSVEGKFQGAGKDRVGLITTVVTRPAVISFPYGGGVTVVAPENADKLANLQAEAQRASGCGGGRGCVDVRRVRI